MRADDRATAEGILFTDQYQLSMAQLYFRRGLHERRAQFDYSFRTYPDYGRHQAGYCVAAGMGWMLDWLEETRFRPRDLDLLRSQRGSAGAPVFGDDFLGWLEGAGHFGEVWVRAIPEGRVVHPYAPAAIVEGPLAMAQILETSFLNHLNYQTLIATKASRVREAGQNRPVLEFGLRRGPAMGANAGARAALIGGAESTSNVGTSHLLGIEPKGTHAHSMVQVFMALGEGELDAFRAYAEVYPDDCVLLVDTIDTLDSGVPNAITVFRELRERGHQPRGIRLDSGDLAYLGIQAARMLDAAGFEDVDIVLSSNLDELAMWQILSQIEQEAGRYGVDPAALRDRLVYGVGTRLITSQGQSALDGVYKLVALDDGGEWQPALKISESAAKIPAPGAKAVWRIYDRRGSATADVVSAADEDLSVIDPLVLHHPYRDGIHRELAQSEITRVESLLEPTFVDGRRVRPEESIDVCRARRVADLELLDPGVRRLVNPHIYHVSITDRVKRLQRDLIAMARASVPDDV